MSCRLASPHNNTQHRSSSVGGAVVECESQQGNGIAEAAEMQGPRADEQSDLQHEEPQPDRWVKATCQPQLIAKGKCRTCVDSMSSLLSIP